jgi:hypothetical protein
MSDLEVLSLTLPDALVLIKKARKVTFFVVVHQQAEIADLPGRVFEVSGSVKVTRNSAVKFVTDAYMTLAKRGALVTISRSEFCVFIG